MAKLTSHEQRRAHVKTLLSCDFSLEALVSAVLGERDGESKVARRAVMAD
jgi:hypothetical protein